MKRFNPTQWRRLLLGGLMLCGVHLSARAGIFTWSAPAAITTADATLTQSGTVVGAASFGPNEEIVTLSSGGVVDFKANGSVAALTGGGAGTSFGAFTNDTGNANFNAALNEYTSDGGPDTITLYNLVPGQQYSVQLFALDQSGGVPSSEVANFQDPNDASDVSANFEMGNTVYFIATFTAPSTSVSIQENLLNSNDGNINALVVRELGANIPVQITSQPQPVTLYNGETASLTAAAIGSAPVTYQWQKGNVGGNIFTNLVNGGRISGATSNILTISNLTATDMADYVVVAANAFGSVTSSPAATLTVLAGTPQFAWSTPATITTADGTLNQTGAIVGAESFGATETLATLTNGTVVDFKTDGSVAAVTAGGFGTATGAFSGDTGNANFNAVLDEFTYDGGPDIITLNNLFVGQQYTVQLFALDDRGGTESDRTANYQDPNDTNDTSSTFAMGNNVYTIGTFTAGSTTVSIQENLLVNNDGNINALVVRALGVIVAPQISTPPSAVTIDQGLITSFTVAASGSTPLTYRWQRGPVGAGVFTNLPASVRYSGATSSTLVISNAAMGDMADYQVIVANAAGSVTSTPPATLTVEAVTPQFVWSLPTAITTADATLNQSGTIVGAAVFGPSPAIVVLTNGTSVDFKNDGSVATATGAGITTGAFSGNTGNSVFNSVLNEFNYDNGPKTISLSNLVAGVQYSVQLFALDDRSGTSSRNANFQNPADANDDSEQFFMPNNVYTLGTFTASASSVNLQENLFNGGGGNINALVVRQLTGLPLAPQITTQPQSISVTPGATAQFTVGATGTALTYQWQSEAIGGSTFANVSNYGNVSGANTAQLSFDNAAGIYNGNYRVIVSNSSGSVTSSPAATLIVRPPANLIHRWDFNETSGTIAHDSVGTADGTLQGGASFSNGVVVLNNPGNPESSSDNSYVSIPGGLVSGLTAVTFEGWISNSGLNNGNSLIGFGGPITGNLGTNFINFFLRMPGSQIAFQINSTAGNSGVVNLGTRQQNGYFHFVLTYDPVVGNALVYVNGSLYGSASGIYVPLSSIGTQTGLIGYSVWDQSISDIIPNSSNVNCPFYNGTIDEVRIYDGALTPNAIAATDLLGANQLLSGTASLNVAYSAGQIVFAWPIINGAFVLETSPALGLNAVWTPVSGTPTVTGSNYQMSVPISSANAFFRLRE
jgi:hypothetical protein